MIKVSVVTIYGISFGAVFESSDLANAWIAEQESLESWGKKARWEREDKLSSEQIATATESAEIDNPYPGPGEPAKFKIYKLPAEYTVLVSDISAEVAVEKAIEKGLSRQEFGARLLARIFYVNESKLAAGAWDSAKWQAFISNTTFGAIERLLWNGSLVTASQLISTLDSTYYSTDERNEILSLISEYLSKEP